MVSAGILVVSNVKQISRTLKAIGKKVNPLYIHLNIPVELRAQPLPSWGRMISQLYVESSHVCDSEIDMRILVPGKDINITECLRPVHTIFSDAHFPDLCEALRKHYGISSKTIYLHEERVNDICATQSASNEESHKTYETVVLGGTFDRIHLGHKIFLTQAVLRTLRKLVVGVTTAKMTSSKTLPELILPVEERIRDVQNFLMEINPSLEYEVVPIDDPFGPTRTDPNMDMIVVSAETLRGGHKVNEIRVQNNLRPLEIFCIDVVEDNNHDGPKEAKISSSNKRIDLLGTRLRQPEPRPHLPLRPYIIGLTGCIASGKSKMAERLQKMGAVVIDCDKIAHEVYEPGKDCFNRIVQHFGSEILDTSGRIDRRKLGPIVFANPAQLEALNMLVWPEIMKEVKQRIQILRENENPQVVVLEAAVLLKAAWQSECHEVWSMIVPVEIAKQRVMERNKLSAEEAEKRLASQLSNSEIVANSHVVFSSQWHSDFTQQQAARAWQMLMRELEMKGSRTSSL